MANTWAQDFGLEPAAPKPRNAIVAGLSSGVDQLQGLGYSAAAAVADTVGAKGPRDWLNERAALNEREAQINGRPDLESVEDAYAQGKLPSWAMYQLAKQVPIMAGAIGTGLALPAAAAPAALSRALAMGPRAAGMGGMGARVAATDGSAAVVMGAQKAALRTGQTFANQLVGGGAFNAATGAGSLYQEAVEGGNADAGPISLLGALPYALTETLPQAMLVGRVGHGALKGGLAARMGKAAATQAPLEVGTELVQNEMEMAYNGSVTPEQAMSRRLNSAAAGGLVGGIFGSAGGVRSGAPRAQVPGAVNDTVGGTTDVLAPTLQLGWDGASSTTAADRRAGHGGLPTQGQTPFVTFPDGSTATTADAALMHETGIAEDQLASIRNTGAPGALPHQMGQMPPRFDPSMAVEGAGGVAPYLPGTMIADEGGQVALDAQGADALYGNEDGDPGTAEARRRYIEGENLKRQEGEKTARVVAAVQEKKAERVALAERTKKYTTKEGSAAMDIFADLERQRDAGLIDEEGMVNDAALLSNGENGKVRSAIKARDAEVLKAQEAAKGEAQNAGAAAPDGAPGAGTRVRGPAAQPAAQPAAPRVTRQAAAKTAEQAVDVDTGAAVTKLAYIAPKPGHEVVTAVESDDQSGFRKSFGGKLEIMPPEDRMILERWLGVEMAPSDEAEGANALELTGASESYGSIGKSLTDQKTGKRGISKQAVAKRVKAALIAAGAEGDVSPAQLYKKLGFQLGDMDLEALDRMTADWNGDLADDAAPAKSKPEKRKTDAQANAENDAALSDMGAAESDTRSGWASDELTALEDNNGVERSADDEAAAEKEVADNAALREAERNITLDDILGGDLVSGAVTQDDIAEATFLYDKTKGTGAWGRLQDIQKATAARYYAQARLRSDAAVLETKKAIYERDEATAGGQDGQSGQVSDALATSAAPQGAARSDEGADVQGSGGLDRGQRQEVDGHRPQPVVKTKRALARVEAPAPVAERKKGTLGAKKAAPAQITHDNVIENDAAGNPLVTEKVNQAVADAGLNPDEVLLLEDLYDADVGTEDFAGKVLSDVTSLASMGPGAFEGLLQSSGRAVASAAKAITAALRKIVVHVMAAAVLVNAAFNPNVSTPAHAAATGPTTVTVTTTQQLRVAKAAALGDHAASPAARKVMDYAASRAAADTISLVMDGPTATMYVMKGAQVVASQPVLYGKAGVSAVSGAQANKSPDAMTDADKVTPSGVFSLSKEADSEYGSRITFLAAPNGQSAYAFHRVYLGDPKERRAQRLASPGVADKAVSYGCVNVGSDFYDKTLSKLDYSGRAFAYIMPTDGTSLNTPGPLTRTETTTKTVDSARAEQSAGQQGMAQDRRRPPARSGSAPRGARSDGKEPASTGGTVKSVLSALSGLMPINRQKVIVVQAMKDLPPGAARSVGATANTQAFVLDGKAYLIADQIDPGTERAVFLHEVGAHLGMENLLGESDYDALVDKITAWAGQGGNSLEKRLAIKAMKRVHSAGTSDAQANSELVAYFIEEAVNAGVDPTAMKYNSEIGRWMREMFAAFKSALAKLGLVDAKGLTAQDIVDLAYGAAKIEMDSAVSQSGDAQFSKRAEAITAALPPRAKTAWTNTKDAVARFSPYLLTNLQMAEQYVKIKSLRTVTKINDLMREESTKQQMVFDAIAKRWSALAPAMKTLLDQVALRSTLQETHPDLAFDDKANGHLKREDAAENAAQKAKHAVLFAQYRALSKEAKDIYQDAKTTLEASRDRMVKETETLQAAYGVTRSIPKQTPGPYFPLMRFGDYLAIGESKAYQALADEVATATPATRAALAKRLDAMKRDPKHFVVSAHETRADMETAHAEYAAQGLDARKSMAGQRLNNLPREMNAMVQEMAQNMAKHFDGETASAAVEAFAEMLLKSLPELNVLNRQAQRKGVEGASPDMQRAVAAAGRQNAFYTSRLMYGRQAAEAMLAMKTEVKGDIDLQHVHREMEKRAALDLVFKDTPVQDALSQAGHVWYLAASPTYLLMNMMQPWLVTGPVLAGKFGLAASTKALARASREALMVLKDARWKDGKWSPWEGISETSVPGKSVNEDRKALRELMQRGVVNEGLQHSMAMYAAGSDGKLAKLVRGMGWFSEQVEITNRVATALASFRLARAEKGSTYESALDYAYATTVNTQMDYSQENTARFMRDGGGVPAAKLVFQFRRYQQAMLYLFGSNIKKLTDPAERKAAGSTLAYFAVTSALSAGVLGLPFMGVALGLANAFKDDDDEDGDAQTVLRNALFDLTGDKELATVLAKGLPAMFGMDLSARIGQGGVASPFPMLDLNGATGQDKVGRVLAAVAGPVLGGLGAAAFDAASYFAGGDYVKGTEKLLPKVAADVLRASRYATEGVTDRKGEQILGAEEISAWDIVLRAVGTTATQQSNYYEGTRALKGTERAVTDRKSRIQHEYVAAVADGDMGDVRAKIDEFNADHPAAQIKPKDEMGWRKNARRSASQRDETGIKFDPKRDGSYADTIRFAR